MVAERQEEIDLFKSIAKGWPLTPFFRSMGADLQECTALKLSMRKALLTKPLFDLLMPLPASPEVSLPPERREAIAHLTKNLERLRAGKSIEVSKQGEAQSFEQFASNVLLGDSRAAAEKYLVNAIFMTLGPDLLSSDLTAAEQFRPLAVQALTACVRASTDVLNAARTGKITAKSSVGPAFSFYVGESGSGDALLALAVLEALDAPDVKKMGTAYLTALRGAMVKGNCCGFFMGTPYSENPLNLR